MNVGKTANVKFGQKLMHSIVEYRENLYREM